MVLLQKTGKSARQRRELFSSPLAPAGAAGSTVFSRASRTAPNPPRILHDLHGGEEVVHGVECPSSMGSLTERRPVCAIFRIQWPAGELGRGTLLLGFRFRRCRVGDRRVPMVGHREP